MNNNPLEFHRKNLNITKVIFIEFIALFSGIWGVDISFKSSTSVFWSLKKSVTMPTATIIYSKPRYICIYSTYTLPETNITSENEWLEDEIPFGMTCFQMLC